MIKKSLFAVLACVFTLTGCSHSGTDVIFDTDANNELDDQHAIAYMLLNRKTFNVLGVTTNVTINGGIEAQVQEVERVAALVGKYGKGLNILPGAEANFEDIVSQIAYEPFDGCKAVDFIIESAKKYTPEKKLTIVPVGKLTNIALAFAKAPEIIPNVRIVWLGSNYPEGGEHNLRCDIPSMNYVIESGVEFEMVVVRSGKPSGTDAVRVSIDQVGRDFAGKGPKVEKPVTGRHGGEFTCFGDYSLDLFDHIRKSSDGTRALFDLVTLAIVKNPSWGHSRMIPAPVMVDGEWVERPDNEHKITIWENFDKDAIIADFIASLDK